MSTTTTAKITPRAPEGRLRAELEAQISGLEQWAAALPCQRPVRMMKHVVDGITGEVAAESREVLMRCNTRQVSRCPPCAALYRGDTRAIIFEGLRSAIDAGEQVVFLTLTAPSFGRTHLVPPTTPPRLNRRRKIAWEKRYRRPCPCGLSHAPGDSRWKGLPLDPGTYNYDGQVAWNAEAGRLWSRTADELARVLGIDRLAYCGSAEWQARGAIHLHLILRVPDGIDLELVHDPAHTGKRSAVIERAVASVATFTGPNRTGTRVTWGPQCVAELVSSERNAFRTAGYLAKLVGYTTKDLAAPARAVPTEGLGRIVGAMMNGHRRRLDEAAARLTCGRPGTSQAHLCRYRQTGETAPGAIPMENGHRAPCRGLRHKQWGWRGHVTRKSRSWAQLTMGECRRRRSEFGKLQRLADGRDVEDEGPVLWERPADGDPMQVELSEWPRLRDGLLTELKTQLLTL